MGYNRMAKKKVKRQRTIIASLILGIVAIGIVFGVGFQLGWWSPYGVTTVTPGDTFTLTLKSNVDGEDVSDFVEVSIWVVEDEDDIEDFEDVLTIANFEEEEKSKNAEDINMDISGYSYIWVEIDPDGESVFANEFRLLTGTNGHYTMYVHHLSSDVNINVLDETLDEITVGAFATDGNYTIILDVPADTTTNIHGNSDDWDCTDEDWDELTADEKLEYYDEGNWRDQAPLYDPSDDTEKDYVDELERLTNAFAIRLTMNGTISTTDGNVAQVNFTLSDADTPAEIVISGVYIYIIYYETITFKNGARSYECEMEFGAQIHLDQVETGRLVVPKDDDNLGTFTQYSTIGA